jgi:transcriptional regulator with XRE-family HTH domain
MILKLRRIAAGLRQQDVAARAGMSATKYSSIERGEREPSETERQLIGNVLPLLSLELAERLSEPRDAPEADY